MFPPDRDKRNIALHSRPESVEAYRRYVDKGLTDDEAAAIMRYFSRDSARVLDVGCGAGRTTRVLEKMGFDSVGIDVSEPMANEAQSSVADTPIFAADAAALGFKDEVFDYALFSYNGLDLLWPEQKRHNALREIHRVLKPGGIFVFSSRNTWGLPSFASSPSWRTLADIIIVLGYRLVFGTVKKHYEKTGVGIRTGDWDAEGLSYFISQEEQRRQLQHHGFKLLDVLGRSFGYKLHYVAWKPPE